MEPAPTSSQAGIVPATYGSAGPGQGASPWWLRGAAIVLVLLTLLNLLNAAATSIGLRFAEDALSVGIDDPGPYPSDGSAEEQAEWNATVEAIEWLEATRALMADERMGELASIQLTAALAALPIAAIGTALLLAQDRRGLIACAVWVVVGVVAQIRMMSLYDAMQRDHYSALTGADSDLMMTIQQVAAPIQIGLCNLTLLAMIALVAMMTRGDDSVDPSGFHPPSR